MAATDNDAVDMSQAVPIQAIQAGYMQPPASTKASSTADVKDDDDPVDMSKATAISQPSAPTRYAGAATESFGLPADIRRWPQFAKDTVSNLTKGPLPHQPGSPIPAAEILNTIINSVRGIAKSSASASQSGLDQINQPGLINKSAGALKYIIGGIPIAGPSIVKSMTSMENGDYAGGAGTLTGMGLQAMMANPEVSTAYLNAAGRYLFSKPRVAETMLAGEAKEMLTQAELKVRTNAKAMFPQSDATVPGSAVSDIANKAINDNIQGTQETPGPLKAMTDDDVLKRIGSIENVGGGLRDIYARMGSSDSMSMDDLHGFYTELGRFIKRGKGTLPGDVFATVKQTQDDLGNLIGNVYKSDTDPITGQLKRNAAGVTTYDQWQDAKAHWSDVATHWWDSDSPLKKAMDANDPGETLHALLGPNGDSAERATSYLKAHEAEGADPNIIKATQRLYKGMTQMTLRGLYQAGGALIFSLISRSAGMPLNEAVWGATAIMMRRLGAGYVKTRPSLTSLLSEAADKPSLGRQLPTLNVPSTLNGGPSSPSSGPSSVTPVTPSSPPSDISPSEASILSSVANHPTIDPALKDDIKNAIMADLHDKMHIPNDQLANISIMRLKSIMSIMRKQGIGYNDASKVYDASDKIGGINK